MAKALVLIFKLQLLINYIKLVGKQTYLGYLGLWPTITHIGQSKRGRRVGVRCIIIVVRTLLNLLSIVVVEITILCFAHKSDSKSHITNPWAVHCYSYFETHELSREDCSSHGRLPCQP